MELYKPILIELVINSIDSDELINVSIESICIYINKKYYIISLHKGLDINHIIINTPTGIIKIKDYIKCIWNDLLIIPMDLLPIDALPLDALPKDVLFSSTFVFKQFVKKQMDSSDKITANGIKLKYQKSIFTPISMIPGNPSIMYNVIKMSKSEIKLINSGTPIVNQKNKLCGIVSMVEDNILYCIPLNYILIALNRTDNNIIYTINENFNNIKKINNYKIILKNKIYCKIHKMNVPIDCFINIHGDTNSTCRIVLNDGIEKQEYYRPFINNIIPSQSELIVRNNVITFNSGLLCFLKLIHEYTIISNILLEYEKNTMVDFTYDDIKYKICL